MRKRFGVWITAVGALVAGIVNVTRRRRKQPALRASQGHAIPTVIAAPAYDPLTRACAGWVSRNAARLAGGTARMFLGNDVTWPKVAESLQAARRPLLFVFWGHGSSEGLLHLPELHGRGASDGHVPLCGATHLAGFAPLLMIAYCCSAARTLSVALTTAHSDSRVLGFVDEIPFQPGNSQREDAFLGPIGRIVSDIADGSVSFTSEVEGKVRSDYLRERDRWMSGDRSADPLSMLVCLYLEEHADLLLVA